MTDPPTAHDAPDDPAEGQHGWHEVLVMELADDGFHPAFAAALDSLVTNGHIAVTDLVFVSRDESGSPAVTEVGVLDERLGPLYSPVQGAYGGLLSDADLTLVAAGLAPGATVAVLVYDNLWARRFPAVFRTSGAAVLVHERIPAGDVTRAFAALVD